MSAATEVAEQLRSIAARGPGSGYVYVAESNLTTLADTLDPPKWKPEVGKKALDLMGHSYTVRAIHDGYAFIESSNGGMSSTLVSQLREPVAYGRLGTFYFTPQTYNFTIT